MLTFFEGKTLLCKRTFCILHKIEYVQMKWAQPAVGSFLLFVSRSISNSKSSRSEVVVESWSFIIHLSDSKRMEISVKNEFWLDSNFLNYTPPLHLINKSHNPIKLKIENEKEILCLNSEETILSAGFLPLHPLTIHNWV